MRYIIIVLIVMLSGCATKPDVYDEISMMLKEMEKKGTGIPADFPIPAVTPMYYPVPVMPMYYPGMYYGHH